MKTDGNKRIVELRGKFLCAGWCSHRIKKECGVIDLLMVWYLSLPFMGRWDLNEIKMWNGEI